jgi:hypothetical protein
MKAAFYGNNLNFGYFFVRMLRQRGLDATLICPEYRYEQEQHQWWTDEAIEADWVYPVPSVPVGRLFPLKSLEVVRELYRRFESYDVLLLMEEGPALFSELPTGPAKIFVSQGFDLTHLPFYLSHYLSLARALRFYAENFKWAARGDLRALYSILRSLDRFPREVPRRAAIQRRQRRGLTQCAWSVCGPQHVRLVDKIGLDRDTVRFLPLPMDTDVLAEVDEKAVARLRRDYAGYDLVFFHPTRHYYLREDNDIFLKDNDKLLDAYACFLREAKKPVKLLLVRKGREHDLRQSERLVAELQIEDAVEWLPEMPNKTLRAFYQLPQSIVCDQFSPHLAVLGNIGREASYFGRPLITAFRSWNELRYGEDLPEHVFPAQTRDEILAAMRTLAAMTPDQRESLSQAGTAWFFRNHAQQNVMNRWIELITSCRQRRDG